MSSGRSRNGGRRTATTSSRNSRSSRKRPCRTRSARSRWVAQTSRKSTGYSRMSPTGLTRFSCKARNSRTCASSGMSPISSRNKVPPSACRKRPGWSAVAPVKAPFLCPNNSLSSRPGGNAPQLTVTKGPRARGLRSCRYRAKTSLPVPLSPCRHTGQSRRAAASQRRRAGSRGEPGAQSGAAAGPAYARDRAVSGTGGGEAGFTMADAGAARIMPGR